MFFDIKNHLFYVFNCYYLHLGYIFMSKGFSTEILDSKTVKKVSIPTKSKGRLISWSPWPPADFQTKYPAFPFVLTILIIVIGKWYISLLR